jgi:hypothetical protein
VTGQTSAIASCNVPASIAHILALKVMPDANVPAVVP